MASPSTDVPHSNPSGIRGNHQEVSVNVHHGGNTLRAREQLFGGTLSVRSHTTHNDDDKAADTWLTCSVLTSTWPSSMRNTLYSYSKMIEDVVVKEPATLATDLSGDNEYTNTLLAPQTAVCSY